MPDQLYIDPSVTTAQVVQVAGVCYQRAGPSSQPPDTHTVDAEFETCDACGSSSSSSSMSPSCGNCDYTTWPYTGYPFTVNWNWYDQTIYNPPVSSGSVTLTNTGGEGFDIWSGYQIIGESVLVSIILIGNEPGACAELDITFTNGEGLFMGNYAADDVQCNSDELPTGTYDRAMYDENTGDPAGHLSLSISFTP